MTSIDSASTSVSATNNNSRNLQHCRIFYATQSGRAKACARRTARMLQEQTSIIQGAPTTNTMSTSGANILSLSGTTFDAALESVKLNEREVGVDDESSRLVRFCTHLREQQNEQFLLLFVSTTGDGEHTDTIQRFWKQLYVHSIWTVGRP